MIVPESDFSHKYYDYKLVDSNDSILRQKMPKYDFSENPLHNSYEIAHILAQHLIKFNGIGLAAPQIGIPVRAFIMQANPLICCFNPSVIDKSSELVYLEEGCLTFPDLVIKIKRPKYIKVRYYLPNGEMVITKLIGMSARIFQHELDHLDGILFQDRANEYYMEKAKKKFRKKVI